jgi:hypothetical protein
MRNHVSLSTIFALLIFALGSQGAPAQETAPTDVTFPGKFYNTDGTAVIYFMIMKPSKANPQKSAGLGMQYQHVDDKYHFDGTYTKLLTGFYATGDWKKFVSLWKKARAAPRPAQNDYTDTDKGSYFDEADNTLVSVGPNSDGDISFTMAGNPGENNTPRDINIFYLAPKDFPAFDRAMKKVSAYFGK